MKHIRNISPWAGAAVKTKEGDGLEHELRHCGKWHDYKPTVEQDMAPETRFIIMKHDLSA